MLIRCSNIELLAAGTSVEHSTAREIRVESGLEVKERELESEKMGLGITPEACTHCLVYRFTSQLISDDRSAMRKGVNRQSTEDLGTSNCVTGIRIFS